MEDENVNDDLNSEEFSDFLGKYKDYFEKNKPNHDDLSFLDKKEHPSDDDVIELFITPDDSNNSVDISNYDLSELGMPNAIKSLEGTEWRVSKMIWFKPEGRVISFALMKMDEYQEMLDMKIKDEENFPWFQLSGAQEGEMHDIDYEEISEYNDYVKMLEGAIEDEDYVEAARLRDWFKTLNELIAQAFNLSNNNNNNATKLFEKLDEISKFRNTL